MKNKLILPLVLLSMTGCATIIEGTTQNVNFSTINGESVKATITSDNGTVHATLPESRSFKKSYNDISVTVKETKCIVPTTTVSKPKLNPWFFGNIITGGVVGSTTDAISGAMWEYDENVMVNVDEKDSCAAQ